MIDFKNIINYDRTDVELEELAIFCICVAGKTARIIAQRVDRLYTYMQLYAKFDCPLQVDYKIPFKLDETIKWLGIGCSTQKAEGIYSLAQAVSRGLNLRTCTVEELEDVKWIGPKTARFFIMSSRQGVQYAALDSHVLKFLRDEGVENVPKTTPTGKNYARLEKEFLDRVPTGETPATFDLKIWKKYSGNDN